MNDGFSLAGKVALVTGSARGIGAAMACALAAAGADVVVHGREPAETETVLQVRALGRKAVVVAADLSARAEQDRLLASAVAAFGRLDILVNNAGIIRRAAAAEHSDDDWDALLELDLTSVFRLCRLAGRHFLEQGSGKIVNIASLLAFQGGIRVPAYAAAKGGVAQLTKALANEWASRGVNVNAIAPGYIATDNTEALRQDGERSRQIVERIPAGRWGKPSDLGGACVFLCSAASDYVHGHVLCVDGGWLAR
jgi:2-dehydro-3-deoxy-D-gluconate 5-dehydrogenase